MPTALRNKGRAAFGGALVLVGLIAAYSNHFHNSFHFDDAHTIETNASIRELRNIPLFFHDATTFSSLPQKLRLLCNAWRTDTQTEEWTPALFLD